MTLVDKIRKSIIATVFYRTADANRAKGFGKGRTFYRKLKIADENRVKELRKAAEAKAEAAVEKTGTGVADSEVKRFASVTEVTGRLMLLISSNVGVEIDIEIIDILDHLRSKNLLTSAEYEMLHRDLISAT